MQGQSLTLNPRSYNLQADAPWCSRGHWLGFVSFVPKKTSSFVQITRRIGNSTKIPQRPPALELTPSSSGCRPPALAPRLPSRQGGQAKPGCSPFPWLGEHQDGADPPTRHLFPWGIGWVLGQGRLVVGTEQPLYPFHPVKPSAFPNIS